MRNCKESLLLSDLPSVILTSIFRFFFNNDLELLFSTLKVFSAFFGQKILLRYLSGLSGYEDLIERKNKILWFFERTPRLLRSLDNGRV